ncbi:hypothetical protein NP233_g1817 [Leucocoprinus birnbaumii]|uniref:galacturonan 1,4-alpha-galacturonidase n=1 Tax=Leucocoprinus birnbaumii TaxID=56174 RepID=A0AAD5VZG2_9AGAR|nr:hypothetical protein NP233_g1817 [Leucocoprinus birnbaumii]
MRLSQLFVTAACISTTFAWNTFTVAHSPGQDDTPALVQALPDLAANTSIVFKKGVTYNLFTPIKFPVLNNVEIVIEGNLTYPEDIATVQGALSWDHKLWNATETVTGIYLAYAGHQSFPGSWLTFSGGNNVTLRGSTDPQWGWIDGHGQAWWDAARGTSGLANRPHGIAFSKITNGVIRDMKLWKPVAWNFATSGSSNLHVFNNRIHAVSNSDAFPFNTDGFSAGGQNMLFEKNVVQNGDDCLTVGNGAKNIVFRDSYCQGGHGLSIGSLGKGGQIADVQNVMIENVVMVSTLYGARFKSWTGGNGLARNITWKNIAFHDVPFPIYVTQNYWDQNTGPMPNSTNLNNTHIQDFLFENFVGDIKDTPYVEGSCVTDPCWYSVPNATGKEVAILDLYPGTASNIRAEDIFARTQSGASVAVMCDPKTVDSDVGFKCWDGTFIRTPGGL